MGRIAKELRAKQYDGFERNFALYLYESNSRGTFASRNPSRLSPRAARLLNKAYAALTGIELHVNRYYLADSFSEAIEAAEALGL